MPRTNNISTQNTFVKGLVTEATGLTFPENACTDTDNCTFDVIGNVSRRNGIDFEDQYSTYTASLTGNVVVSYLWKSVSGQGDITFTVVQIGDNLHFYKVLSSTAISANKHATVIALSTFMPVGITTVSTIECQFTSGNGILFVTNPNLNSFSVTYDPNANTFSTSVIDIKIRDFEGDSADALAIDNRPTAALAGITAAHRYNLQNQGWTTATLTSWDTARTDMPSNCDVSWYYKNASNAFDFTTVDNRSVGNSPAPQGHYVYSIYNVNRSANFSGASDTVIATDRVATCAFFEGRVFYAGLRSARHASRIFFSQIIERPSQYGYCYQSNDPTSEELFNLLPGDGGTIDLIDAGIVLKMVPVLNAMIVFCTNGVWSISGSQNSAFAANDYTISKISNIQNVSSSSFVDVEGTPYWWTLDGIWRVVLDPQTHALSVQSITYSSILSFFDLIPLESKLYARGVYDPEDKKIQWIYKSSISTSFEDKYVFDRLLNFNTLTSAFYPWSISSGTVNVHSLVDILGVGGAFSLTGVLDSANTVIDGADTVIVYLSSTSGISSTIKFFSSYVSAGSTLNSFAEERKDRANWTDWYALDSIGTSFSSYITAGYMVRGDGIRRFQDNYVNVFSDNSVDSSFKIRGLWNYSTSPNVGKWSTSQILTNTAGSYAYRPHRVKIRGSGIAAQIKIENNANADFNIIGWSIFESASKWV